VPHPARRTAVSWRVCAAHPVRDYLFDQHHARFGDRHRPLVAGGFRPCYARGRLPRRLSPFSAFPYDHYTKLSDDDVKALYAFFMTRPPVRATAPANTIPFPLNIRALQEGWKIVFFRNGATRTPLLQHRPRICLYVLTNLKWPELFPCCARSMSERPSSCGLPKTPNAPESLEFWGARLRRVDPPSLQLSCADGGASAAAHAAVFSEALFSERDAVALIGGNTAKPIQPSILLGPRIFARTSHSFLVARRCPSS
jgi:hypothetical protein